jgi:hypothetical protein
VATASNEQTRALYVGIEKTLVLMNRGSAYEVQILYALQRSDAIHYSFFEDTLVKLYEHLLNFLASALLVQQRSSFGKAFHAFWKPEDILLFGEHSIELESTLEAESRILDSILNREQGDHVKQLLEASECLEAVASDTKTLLEALRRESQDQRRKDQEAQVNSEALAWLSDIPVYDHHKFAKEGRTPNTGQWVFKKREFKQWRNTRESALLWIHGIRKLKC